MSQQQYTTKRKTFNHLTYEKRTQIALMLRLGYSKTRIAEELNISRSTLHRELKRGSVPQLNSDLTERMQYFPDVGQRVYKANRANCRPPLKLHKAFDFINFAQEEMLEHKLSPDAICGREKIENRFTETVCTKTLYNYIDQCLLRVRNIDLPLRVKRKRNNSDISHGREHKRLYGISIEERPAEINDRSEFGHWEIDTVIGKQKSSAVLLTLDERTTRMRLIVKISGRNSEAVAEGIEQLKQRFGDKFPAIFRSITSDNGSEFAQLPKLFNGTTVYYAHPYSAYERGTNEKQNSLLRRFYPKGCSFDDVTPDEIAYVEHWINALPRKLFNYRSADELFESVLFDLAI